MDWGGRAVFGLVATTLLTTVLVLVQLLGRTPQICRSSALRSRGVRCVGGRG